MPISVQILVVVRGPVGRTLASSNDSLEGILGLRLGAHRQLDRSAFRQGNRLLGLKCSLGIDGFDGDTHGSPTQQITCPDGIYRNAHDWIFLAAWADSGAAAP